MDNEAEPKTQYLHQYPWVNSVQSNSIVVLQVAGWFHANWEGFEVALLRAFNATARHIDKPDWAKQLVVFSSNIGHDKCHDITDWPLTEPINYSTPHKYSWHNIGLLNSIAEKLTNEVGGTFLDVTTMLSYRPDGHMETDCGHWCLPSAYDITAHLFFNAVVGRIGVPLSELSPRRF